MDRMREHSHVLVEQVRHPAEIFARILMCISRRYL
jgi:hypothetical protein